MTKLTLKCNLRRIPAASNVQIVILLDDGGEGNIKLSDLGWSMFFSAPS